MITPKQKTTSLPTLIKELDTVFSLFIRLRDADERGTVTCFVTGEKVWWKDSDAAHFIPRGIMPTRYNERNVHACTKESNQFDEHHQAMYEKKMIEAYGHNFVIGLVMESRHLEKFMRHEIEEKIEHYKMQVSKLKKSKGL